MPAGWTPKSTAPIAFTMGQALAALITGQADSWLSDWLYLIPDTPLSTANLCTNVNLTPPALTLADFSALIPTSNPTLPGLGVGISLTMLGLQEKLAAYAAARIGAAYCEGPLGAPGTFGDPVCVGVTAGPISGGDHPIWIGPLPTGTTQVMFNWTQWTRSPTDGAGRLYNAARSSWVDLGGFGGSDHPAYLGPVAAEAGGWFLIDYTAGAFADSTATLCYKTNDGTRPTRDPTIDPAPPNLPPPATNVYVNIPDLGKELDVQEHKLDLIRDLLTYLTNVVAPPAITISAPLPATGEIPLQQAKGIVVTVSAIPPQVDETFGTPTRYHNLGRITFGTTEAWFAPIDLSENPMIVAPIPPFVTRVQVSVQAPATATYSLIG